MLPSALRNRLCLCSAASQCSFSFYLEEVHQKIYSSSFTSLPQLLRQRQQLFQIFQLAPAFKFADHEVHAGGIASVGIIQKAIEKLAS
jgi:hypothetical protein